MDQKVKGENDHAAVIDPIDWEARYRAGDTPWDEGHSAPALTDFLAQNPVMGQVLVPGSGTGHDVRALAKQGATVTGLDLSQTAVSLANSFTKACDESYEVGDLFQLPSSWHRRFDWVIEHTCFCAIPPSRRSDYVQTIANVLKPRGHFFAIFYTNPAATKPPPFGIHYEEISRLFDPHFQLLEEWVPSTAFEGREGRELGQFRRLL